VWLCLTREGPGSCPAPPRMVMLPCVDTVSYGQQPEVRERVPTRAQSSDRTGGEGVAGWKKHTAVKVASRSSCSSWGVLVSIAIPIFQSHATQARARSCQVAQRSISEAIDITATDDEATTTSSSGEVPLGVPVGMPSWTRLGPVEAHVSARRRQLLHLR